MFPLYGILLFLFFIFYKTFYSIQIASDTNQYNIFKN
jgi:hypothetical protein